MDFRVISFGFVRKESGSSGIDPRVCERVRRGRESYLFEFTLLSRFVFARFP